MKDRQHALMVHVRNRIARPDAWIGALLAENVRVNDLSENFETALGDLLAKRARELDAGEEAVRVAARELLRNGPCKCVFDGTPEPANFQILVPLPAFSFRRSASVMLVLAVAGGCVERGFKPPTLSEVREELAPKQESWGVRFSVSETGLGRVESRARMQIISDYMATYETPDSTYTLMRGEPDSSGSRVLAILFDEAGDTSATVTSHRMLYFESERRFVALGQVLVETPAEKRLETEHLHWNEVDRKVRTPGFARITTPSERVQGYELLADENLDTYSLARVTGQVTVDDD